MLQNGAVNIMRKNFDNQLKDINLRLIKMSAKVEEIIALTIKSLQNKDEELAKKAIKLDHEINEAERETERLCINVLLLQQPVFADDLKSISSTFKILTDLERMGAQARDISSLNLELLQKSGVWNIDLISEMAEKVVKMVSLSIISYSNKDIELAKSVISADDEVDELFYKMKSQLIDYIMSSNDKSIGINALDTFMIAKYFERIADHAENISEWAIYSVTGIGEIEN